MVFSFILAYLSFGYYIIFALDKWWTKSVSMFAAGAHIFISDAHRKSGYCWQDGDGDPIT
jgi:hypothetical protein